MTAGFSDRDVRDLAERGVDTVEAERQLDLLRRPRRYVELVRPCTVGDGVETLSATRMPELHAIHAEVAADGRFSKFTPASGAASRMFRELLQFSSGPGRGTPWNEVATRAAGGDDAALALQTFVGAVQRFPFWAALQEAAGQPGDALLERARSGDYLPLLDALLDTPPDKGLGYARLPKGLLEFHAYPDGNRTPLDEHLVEGADYVRDRDGRCRLHFTVSPEHESGFRDRVAAVEARLGRDRSATFELRYSHQHASTDTLATDACGQPVRDEAGRLLFRPGGHGALIRNLSDLGADLGADLVYVKNIDNVQPDRLKGAVFDSKRALGGYLVVLQRRLFDALDRLDDPDGDTAALDSALATVAAQMHLELDGPPGQLRERLDRPIRVCGVVRNTGEPGGGPFWVRGTDGRVTLQIVESAEVDPANAEQQAIFRSSTHFNPVDLVCALRDRNRRPHDLALRIDEDRVIVASKSSGGSDLNALERPGLWNGAMADWNTVFVEVPLSTFSPVKTILDLLREEHQS